MDNYNIILGDVTDILQSFDDESFSGCFCDPPYGLSFMGREWDGVVPDVRVWSEVFQVLKPGSHLLAFGGTRTWHRLAVAIEDAGFEIRDTIMWVYGSGFPKSQDIGKLIDRKAGVKRKVIGKKTGKVDFSSVDEDSKSMYDAWQGGSNIELDITAPETDQAKLFDGYKTALKPAYEPCILAMKPLDGNYANNAEKHGIAGINIDESRIGTEERTYGGMCDKGYVTGFHEGNWKPKDIEVTVKGRYPANLIHDGSEEVVENFPETKTTYVASHHKNNRTTESSVGDLGHPGEQGYDDDGSAARFFYVPKPSTKERNEGIYKGGYKNTHPTVKPIKLCEYLAQMILPPTDGHKLLVPFSGSGSEIVGSINAGWSEVTGIEISKEFVEIAKQRIDYHCGPKGLEKFMI